MRKRSHNRSRRSNRSNLSIAGAPSATEVGQTTEEFVSRLFAAIPSALRIDEKRYSLIYVAGSSGVKNVAAPTDLEFISAMSMSTGLSFIVSSTSRTSVLSDQLQGPNEGVFIYGGNSPAANVEIGGGGRIKANDHFFIWFSGTGHLRIICRDLTETQPSLT